ncbi:replicative DNA helicase [Anaerosphaera multitolerans]|uniref:Replicative DNA helicase n=1 Tax=Anaerosphaera multitolerans TaxID=2487351 RepID=A0A437S4K4_9FIRM|nr:replicative DNA helicase [Anaerosphaera multitolerans]RVU53962.1 replicative DNA helicase [Anaerosphaera multitolerans]
MDLRIPPHNLDAEQSVLGAMLLSKEAITTAVEVLRGEDFYSQSHGEIYNGILSIYNRNEPADIVTVTEELKKRTTLEEVGGLSYIAGLASSVAAISNTKYYCDIIKEKSTLRRLITASDEIVAKSYSPEAEVNAIIESAEKNIFDITQDSHRTGLVPVKEVLLESFAQMEKRSQDPTGLTGLTTGFVDLDYKLSGFQKSDLILLAARPSMGKTALMVNLATNAALKSSASVAMFSLEMSKHQLVQRIIASMAHVDLQKVISGNLNEDEWIKIINVMPIISELQIEIDDTAGISPLELKAKCRRLKLEKGLDLVVIDYLQLMELDGRVESRQQEISSISRSLKAIAKELEVPVIALSQLSRMPETRTDHRPILSDLRESGAIEQDADIVMFLYRDEYYTKEESEKPNIGEVIIAKHRNGPTGTVELVFKKEYTKFLNMEREY